MQPEKIKDDKLHPAIHPDYNPRTLYVPEQFKQNQTPVSVMLHSNLTGFMCVFVYRL